MDLARRIRGDRMNDFRDTIPKDGQETYLALPYKNRKDGMQTLKDQVA